MPIRGRAPAVLSILTARTVPLARPGRAGVVGVGAGSVVVDGLGVLDGAGGAAWVVGPGSGAGDEQAATATTAAIATAPRGQRDPRGLAQSGHGNRGPVGLSTVREPRSFGYMAPSAIRRNPWPTPWLWGRSPLAAPQPFGRRQRGHAGAFAPGPPRETRGARTAPAAGKAGIRPCPLS